MKKLIVFIMALILSIAFVSCEKDSSKDKSNIYAEKHKIYSKGDTLFTQITVYVTEVDGHRIIYHIHNGKNKDQMEIWHGKEFGCTKCIKIKNDSISKK